MTHARVLAAVVALILLQALRPSAAGDPAAARLVELRREREELRQRLDAAVAKDPLATRALGLDADVALVVRTGFVEALLAEVTHQYFDDVEVDLGAVEATAGGVIRAKTAVGRLKVGEWRLAARIEALRGRLRAGHPQLSFHDDRLDVEVPVEVSPARGRIALDFGWDSSGLANVVCGDFKLRRVLEGRVLRQTHRLSVTIRLASGDGFLSATPVLSERSLPLRVDLDPESWAQVRDALASQDRLGRCGMVLKPDKVLAELRGLAARGIGVRLPDELARSVRLPAHLEQVVRLGPRAVEVTLRRAAFRLDSRLLWSSARISATPEARPAAAGRTASPASRSGSV
jgi:hypothetical protein